MRSTPKATAARIARTTGTPCHSVPGGLPGHVYIVGRRGRWAATPREAWRVARLEAAGIEAVPQCVEERAAELAGSGCLEAAGGGCGWPTLCDNCLRAWHLREARAAGVEV